VNLLLNRWLSMPRARGAQPDRRRRTWRRFSDYVAEHVVWEAVASAGAGRFGRAGKGLAVALRLHPLSVLGVLWVWARFSTLRVLASGLFADHGMAGSKVRLKRARLQRRGYRKIAR
jgi:hypothetical protein